MTIPCESIYKFKTAKSGVDRNRFAELHPDGRQLVFDWARRSQDEIKAGNAFAAMTSLWMAFNAWAACVSGLDADREYIETLKRDPYLFQSFETAKKQDEEFSRCITKLSSFWPIWRAQEVRKKLGNLRWNLPPTREEAIKLFFERGLNQFSPECFKEHKDANEACPVDWPHTLESLYRVRCNLFHGEKSLSSPSDSELVQTAYQCLSAFVTKIEIVNVEQGAQPDVHPFGVVAA